MPSLVTCTYDHGFPWQYRHVQFTSTGAMCCPSCETELERVWSMRTHYDPPGY